MPNICNNNLHIEGSEEDIVRFMNAVKERPDMNDEDSKYSLLQSLYPMPEELDVTSTSVYDTIPDKWNEWLADGSWTQEDYDKRVKENDDLKNVYQSNIDKYGYKDWYDWQYAKWGTKWGDLDTYVIGRNDGYAGFSFNSAWAPPVTAFEYISSQFPELKFYLTYMETGMGFVGCCGFFNGTMYEETSEDISVEGSEDDDFDIEKLYEEYDRLRDECEQMVRDEMEMHTSC